MNIFVLDTDPALAAVAQCDKHVVKMPLETAQLLCTTAALNGATDVRYKPTHRNHPCAIWARTSRANFDWLTAHGVALADEYTRRYGKTHASKSVIVDAIRHRVVIPDGALTPFAQAMPDAYRAVDVVAAYRAYYLGAKRDIATWRAPAVVPSWWRDAPTC